MKLNRKVVDKVISDKHVKFFIENEKKPKKDQSQLNNVHIYDLETFGTVECVPYAVVLHKLGKILGKYYRDITDQELEKCKTNCGVFKGINCINQMLDHILEFKGEAKNVSNKIVKKLFYTYSLTMDLGLIRILF